MTDQENNDQDYFGDVEEDDALCEGDLAPEDIDWDAVTKLENLNAAALALPEGDERSMALLGILHELHGDNLQVL